MLDKIEKIKAKALESIKKVRTTDKLEELRVKYLGRKSELTDVLRGLGKIDPALRPRIGQSSNLAKRVIEEAVEMRAGYLQKKQEDVSLEKEVLDVSLPAKGELVGHIHPNTRIVLELEDYYARMGYMIYQTDNLTNEYDNFDAVNIPKNHPARGMWDTFWVKGQSKEKGNLLLATHTSAIQNRILRENVPPYKSMACGRCFRHEATDATHEHTLHQVEGVVVDKSLSVGHLKSTLMDMMQFIVGERVEVRLRPSYFPFVEPGFEADAQCVKCRGKGCRTCHYHGWIEMLGAGMIHQNVFVEAGYKRNEWTGFAFGVGVERLAMLRYGINDIRHFYVSEQEFIKQF